MDVKPGHIYAHLFVYLFYFSPLQKLRFRPLARVDDPFCHTHTLKKKTPLTDLSQIESRCVGLQARVAAYVNGQEDAVLLLSVRAVGILTVNPRSVQLACDIILVPKAETNVCY